MKSKKSRDYYVYTSTPNEEEFELIPKKERNDIDEQMKIKHSEKEVVTVKQEREHNNGDNNKKEISTVEKLIYSPELIRIRMAMENYPGPYSQRKYEEYDDDDIVNIKGSISSRVSSKENNVFKKGNEIDIAGSQESLHRSKSQKLDSDVLYKNKNKISKSVSYKEDIYEDDNNEEQDNEYVTSKVVIKTVTETDNGNENVFRSTKTEVITSDKQLPNENEDINGLSSNTEVSQPLKEFKDAIVNKAYLGKNNDNANGKLRSVKDNKPKSNRDKVTYVEDEIKEEIEECYKTTENNEGKENQQIIDNNVQNENDEINEEKKEVINETIKKEIYEGEDILQEETVTIETVKKIQIKENEYTSPPMDNPIETNELINEDKIQTEDIIEEQTIIQNEINTFQEIPNDENENKEEDNKDEFKNENEINQNELPNNNEKQNDDEINIQPYENITSKQDYIPTGIKLEETQDNQIINHKIKITTTTEEQIIEDSSNINKDQYDESPNHIITNEENIQSFPYEDNLHENNNNDNNDDNIQQTPQAKPSSLPLSNNDEMTFTFKDNNRITNQQHNKEQLPPESINVNEQNNVNIEQDNDTPDILNNNLQQIPQKPKQINHYSNTLENQNIKSNPTNNRDYNITFSSETNQNQFTNKHDTPLYKIIYQNEHKVNNDYNVHSNTRSFKSQRTPSETSLYKNNNNPKDFISKTYEILSSKDNNNIINKNSYQNKLHSQNNEPISKCSSYSKFTETILYNQDKNDVPNNNNNNFSFQRKPFVNKRIPLNPHSTVSQSNNSSNTNRTVNSNYYDNKDNTKLHYIYSNDKLLQKITNDYSYKPFNNCYSNSHINKQHNNNKIMNQFESPSYNYYTQRRNEIKQNNPCVHHQHHCYSHVPYCCYYEEEDNNNNNTMNVFNSDNDANNKLNSDLYVYEKYSTAHNVKYKPRKKPNDLIINEQHKTPSNMYTYNNNNTQQINNRYMTYESRNEPSNYLQTFINNTNTISYNNEYPYYNQPKTNICLCSNCNNEHCHHHHHCCHH